MRVTLGRLFLLNLTANLVAIGWVFLILRLLTR
jgi:hypothetical protein